MMKAHRLLLALAVFVFTAACATAIHTTEVQPGVKLDLVSGAGNSLGINDSWWIAEIDAGYAWKFAQNLGLQLTLALPLSLPPYSLEFTSLDLYLQFLGDPVDLGVGLRGGVLSGVYAQVGKGFHVGNNRLGVDLGLGTMFDFTSSSNTYIGPFLLLSWRYSFFQLGLWTSFGYQVKGVTQSVCLDDCDSDRPTTNKFLLGGLDLGFIF